MLDASALLCLLKEEKGAEEVLEALPRAAISAVNLSEVYAKLAEAGGPENRIEDAISTLHLRVEPFESEQARSAGMLRPATRPFGFSLRDPACLALARQRSAIALTTDQAWAKLPQQFAISVKVIR